MIPAHAGSFRQVTERATPPYDRAVRADPPDGQPGRLPGPCHPDTPNTSAATTAGFPLRRHRPRAPAPHCEDKSTVGSHGHAVLPNTPTGGTFESGPRCRAFRRCFPAMDNRTTDHIGHVDLPRLPFERNNPLEIPEMYRTLRTTAPVTRV